MKLSVIIGLVSAAVCLFCIEWGASLLDFPFSTAFAEACLNWEAMLTRMDGVADALGSYSHLQWVFPWYRATLALLGTAISSLNALLVA